MDKKKVRYTVRLYRMHDLDLITFIETHEFNLVRAIYSSLDAFAKGEAFVIEIPPRRMEKLPKLNRSYSKALILDSEKDAKAMELLEKIAPGYRNSFMKNLLRLYLCNPLSEEFFHVVKRAKDSDQVIYETPQAEIDEKTEFFKKKCDVFRSGRRQVKAGKLRMSGRKMAIFKENREEVQKNTDRKHDMQEADVSAAKHASLKEETANEKVEEAKKIKETELEYDTTAKMSAEEISSITNMFNNLI